MASTSILFGTLLAVLGVVGYVLSGFASVTALIPAFFGVLLILLGLVARNERYRKHAMHAAAALALVGFLATLPRFLQGASAGQMSPAVISQGVMALLTGIFVVLCIKSFVDARRARSQAG
jgi:hypothetical protein